jgi:hypothetical protein
MSIEDQDPVVTGEEEGAAGCGGLRLTRRRGGAGSRGKGGWHH